MSDYHDENDINDLGLQADLSMWQKKPFERRRILQLGGGGHRDVADELLERCR